MLVQETSLVEKTFKPQIEVKIPMVWSQEPPVPPFPLGCQNHFAGRDATPMDMFGVFARPESIRSNPCPDPTVQQLLCVVKPWGARHITPAWDLTKIWVNASKIIQQNPNTTRSSHQMCHGMSLPQVQKLMKIWGSQEENIRVRESKESPKRKEKGGNSESIIGLWAFQVGSTIKQTHHKAGSFQSGHLEWSAAQSPIYCPFQLITWMFPLFQRNLEASISIHQPYSKFLLQGFEGHQNPSIIDSAESRAVELLRQQHPLQLLFVHTCPGDTKLVKISTIFKSCHCWSTSIGFPGTKIPIFPRVTCNPPLSQKECASLAGGHGLLTAENRQLKAKDSRFWRSKVIITLNTIYGLYFFPPPFTIHSRKRCLSSPRRF